MMTSSGTRTCSVRSRDGWPIASASGSLLETARDGVLVPPGDHDGFARALDALPPSRRDDLRELALERFAPARIYDELEAFLGVVAGQAPVR